MTAAPWSKSLKVISSLATVICLAAAVFQREHLMAAELSTLRFWLALVPLLVLFGALPFVIRGYTLGRDSILIHRLFWTTKLLRADLQSAEFAPKLLQRSIRLFGNGGLFSFTGWYRSPSLGVYRAFMTDPNKAVVLRFGKRTVVVSPENPEEFSRKISGVDPTGGVEKPAEV